MRITLVMALLTCIACLCPITPSAAQSSSTTTAINRQISRLDSTYARFETRAERLADGAIARIRKLDRAGASPERIEIVATQTKISLEVLAATLRADLDRMETATLSIINRHESVSRQLRAFPTVNFDSLRRDLSRTVNNLNAKADLLLDEEFDRLDDAVAEALPIPDDAEMPF